MKIVFDPWTEHKIVHQNVRLVFYDIENKKFDNMFILDRQEGPFLLQDPRILGKPTSYKFKYQVQHDEKWVDAVKYKFLIDENECEDILLDLKPITDIERFISTWNNANSELYRFMKRATYKFMRKFWTNTKAEFKNVPELIRYIESQGFQQTLLGNILFYLKIYLELKNDFLEDRIINIPFNDLFENNRFNKIVEEKINVCEKYQDELQTANILIGKLYSLLGNRQHAADYFERAIAFSPNFIEQLDFDQGVYTYSRYADKSYDFSNKINVVDIISSNNDIVILISLDTNFMRYYGPQLLYYINVLKKYQFHLHVIGAENEAKEIIDKAKDLFNMIRGFRGSTNLKDPVFSWENVPKGVADAKTFFATSRYINAEYFMDLYDSDILIMDADMFAQADPEEFIKSLKSFDVAVPFARSTPVICPWRRILAGTVYIKNNKNGRHFIRLVRDYILQHIVKEKAWTLDQNALFYAYESIIQDNLDIKIGRCNDYDRPFVQVASISKLIETV